MRELIETNSNVEFAPAFPSLLPFGDIFARSEANLAASVIEGTADEKKSSPVRRTFLLVAVIDLIIVIIFWILILKIASDKSFIDALAFDIVHINFNTSMFDNVLFVAARFPIIQIVYGAFKSRSTWTIAIITFATTVYFLVKICMFTFSKSSNGPVLVYTLLIIHILIPWIETIFLECRVFPQEKAAQEVYSALEDARSTANIRGFRNRASTYCISEYGSPNGSLDNLSDGGRNDLTEDAVGVDVAGLLSMGNQIYSSAVILMDDEAWHMNLSRLLASPQNLMVQTANIKGYQCKLFRLDGILKASPLVVFKEIVDGVNTSSSWNPLLSAAKRIQIFKDQNMDVVHTIVNDQAKGLVKSRDFVILRKWGEFRTNKEQYFITSSSVEHPKCPVDINRIRAHQHISATTMVPINTEKSSSQAQTQTHLCMIICTDLKGWIPQTVIDQATTGSLENFFKALQTHISSYSFDQCTLMDKKLPKPRNITIQPRLNEDEEFVENDRRLLIN